MSFVEPSHRTYLGVRLPKGLVLLGLGVGAWALVLAAAYGIFVMAKFILG